MRFSAGPPGLRLVFYAVFHPDGVQRVLAGQSARYRKDGVFYTEIRAQLGDGLATSQDERWLRQRRSLQPLFTHRRVAGYVDAMAAQTSVLAGSLAGLSTCTRR